MCLSRRSAGDVAGVNDASGRQRKCTERSLPRPAARLTFACATATRGAINLRSSVLGAAWTLLDDECERPGPVFITVVEGEVTCYERDDPTCTGKVVRAGEGYVDTGEGHIGRNESGQPARDVTVIIAPVGGSFGGEHDAPSPNCNF